MNASSEMAQEHWFVWETWMGLYFLEPTVHQSYGQSHGSPRNPGEIYVEKYPCWGMRDSLVGQKKDLNISILKVSWPGSTTNLARPCVVFPRPLLLVAGRKQQRRHRREAPADQFLSKSSIGSGQTTHKTAKCSGNIDHI